MRRACARGAAVLAATAALAAPAATASPGNAVSPQVRALQQQVKALQKQVQSLKLGQTVLLATVLCGDSATADALQGTWTVIEQHEQTGTALFGAQAPVNDVGACRALGVQRATLQATTSALQAIINLFKGA